MLPRLLAWLLMACVAWPTGAPRAEFRCPMDGQVRMACCCDGAQVADPAHPGKRGCCDVHYVFDGKTQATQGDVPAPATPMAVVVDRIELPLVADEAIAIAFAGYDARGPPGTAPPRFVRYCCFLI